MLDGSWTLKSVGLSSQLICERHISNTHSGTHTQRGLRGRAEEHGGGGGGGGGTTGRSFIQHISPLALVVSGAHTAVVPARRRDIAHSLTRSLSNHSDHTLQASSVVDTAVKRR